MRAYFLTIPLLALVSCTHVAPKSPAPAETTPPAKHSVSPEEMQAAMKKASTIGPNHQRLNALVGRYKVTAKFWMSPKGEPETSTGTADFRWILGGHYVQLDYKSSFHGQPFVGQGLYGYNNVTSQYESAWADSMGTEIMKSEGVANSDGTSISFGGEFNCPITNAPMKSKQVLLFGKDQVTMEMYHDAFDGSGEFKAMEIVYKKVKPIKIAAKESAPKAK